MKHCVFLSLAATLMAAAVMGADYATKPAVSAGGRAAKVAAAGGFVEKPASGPIVMFLSDGQYLADAEAVAAELGKSLKLRAVAREAKGGMDEAVKAAVADTNTAVAVAVATEPGKPTLLVAPSCRWARVNAAAVPTGSSVRQQLWHAVGYLLGSGVDDEKVSPLPAEVMMRTLRRARELGMEPPRRATYRRAAQEGWAPVPTNDVQKAILEAAKAAKK